MGCDAMAEMALRFLWTRLFDLTRFAMMQAIMPIRVPFRVCSSLHGSSLGALLIIRAGLVLCIEVLEGI